jgi:hypothetical protein
MRWYAWWNNYHFYRAEWWVQRMLFEFYLKNGSEEDDLSDEEEFKKTVLDTVSKDDARTELRKLREGIGSFRLAHQLLTSQLKRYCDILYYVGQVCWTEHNRLISDVRNPQEMAKECIRKVRGGWAEEAKAILVAGLTSHDNMEHFGLVGAGSISDESREACRITAQFALALAENRLWTHQLSMLPPLSYAELMGESLVARLAAANRMKREFTNLLRLSFCVASTLLV